MNIFETLKFIAEVITSIVTAGVVIIHLVKAVFKLCNPLKIFFKTTVPLFFKGFTNLEGKKVRFIKGLRLRRERNKNIIKAISSNSEMENILVFDKEAFLDIILSSKAFYTIQQRKK
jgi:hypothetical protein